MILSPNTGNTKHKINTKQMHIQLTFYSSFGFKSQFLEKT